MKNILITILFLVSFNIIAQNENAISFYAEEVKERFFLPEYIQQYEEYCNEDTTFTIEVSGIINYRLSPVSNTDDVYWKVIDTVWDKIDTVKYYAIPIENDYYNSLEVVLSSWETSFSQIPNLGATKQKSVVRNVKITGKRKKIVPFSNHFWNWLKKQ